MTPLATVALATIIAGGTIGALSIAEPAPATFSGYATIVDGDTLRVGAARVRLAGVDAPEAAQTCNRTQRASTGFSDASWPCGAAATDAMRRMLARDPHVTCQAKATDRYGRTVAVCANEGGDLGARLVAAGWAIAYRRYSLAYVDQEEAAKAERLGIWSGTFEMPEQWRREHKR